MISVDRVSDPVATTPVLYCSNHNRAVTMDDSVFLISASDLQLCAFALTDCTIDIEWQSAKYCEAVHRTALERRRSQSLRAEIGGFWLKARIVEQLKRLPDCYPANESEFVTRAVDAYLSAQTDQLTRFSS